jgi:signal transduction histidine kinase
MPPAEDDARRRAQQMETLGRLTGGIAHELSNLLQVIVSQLDLMRVRGAAAGTADPAQARCSRAIRDAADKARSLTQQLLRYARPQPPEARRVDLNALVHATTALAGRTLGARIAIVLELDAALAGCRADALQLELALLNLLINARDAMPAGGRVTITTRNVALEASAARALNVAQAGAYVELSVADTGTGIAAELLPRVMEPWFTTKPTGTGLGLPMVGDCARAHGGAVAIASQSGVGTTVRLVLPAAPGDAA